MFSSNSAEGGGQVVRVLERALTSQPQLVGFFGFLAFLVVVLALVLYRRHRLKFRRVRSPTGSTGTSLEIVPMKDYRPIDGFDDATMITEWPSEAETERPSDRKRTKKIKS
jgi:hypothetical protein